jgi:hypothetical protein
MSRSKLLVVKSACGVGGEVVVGGAVEKEEKAEQKSGFWCTSARVLGRVFESRLRNVNGSGLGSMGLGTCVQVEIRVYRSRFGNF